MPNQFLSPEGDLENYFVTEHWLIDQYIGDTLLMGKFKNKKVVVKDIGKDDYGMPTINGKKAATFRLGDKGQNIFKKEIDEEFNNNKSKLGDDLLSYKQIFGNSTVESRIYFMKKTKLNFILISDEFNCILNKKLN